MTQPEAPGRFLTTRGVCPHCGRAIRLTSTGMLRRHGSKDPATWPPADCGGTGRYPTEVMMGA